LGGLKKKIGDKQKEFSDFRQFVVGYKKKKFPTFEKVENSGAQTKLRPLLQKMSVCK